MQTGRVYRRVDSGEWEAAFVDGEGELAALLGNAPYVRAMANGSKVVSGSKIITINGMQAMLFSDTQMRSLIGRSFNNEVDGIALANGDWNSFPDLVFGAVYDPAGKTMNVKAINWGTGANPQSATVRINYIISAK